MILILQSRMFIFISFILLLCSVRVLRLFDTLPLLIAWLSAVLLFILLVFFGCLYRRQFIYAVVSVPTFLALTLFYLKYPALTGYSFDYVLPGRSGSNEPTIVDGDFIVSKHLDVVPVVGGMYGIQIDNQLYRKRLHGLPGDKIHRCNEKVYVNAQHYAVSEQWQPSTVQDFATCHKLNQVFYLQADEYYFLGDNTYTSQDSRYFGPITASQIVATSLYLIRSDGSVKQLAVEFN